MNLVYLGVVALAVLVCLWCATLCTARPAAPPPSSSQAPAPPTPASYGWPQEPTGLPVEELPSAVPKPLPLGTKQLTPVRNRGGNAGYTTVDTAWQGGWLGLHLP